MAKVLGRMDANAQHEIILISKALSHEKRVRVLKWLKDPRAHFPAQKDGSRVRDGVCSGFIAQKLEVSNATASAHLKILKRAGLIAPKRNNKWTFYKRDEMAIKQAMRLLSQNV